MEEKFDEKKYKQNYEREHYSRISFVLKKEEAKEFKRKLKEKNISITQFFKDYIKKLK